MKSIWAVRAFFGSLCVLCLGFGLNHWVTGVYARPSAGLGQVADTPAAYFPVELLGPAGLTRTLSLQAPNGVSATALWLQVHGLSYQNKASVRVNGSSWITLSNATASVDPLGARYGGIGGAFLTLKLSVTLPLSTAVNGANQVEFRFNFTDGESMGYRVLNANLLDGAGNMLVANWPGSNKPLPDEDPATWTPPLNTPADIAAGEQLWNARNIMVESPLSTRPVVASCGDCHSVSGYDLKYFNFSNQSIIGRSVFHGLSSQQGAQIASFIRALQIEAPGRPWNPPYQPGPGTEARPVSDWAAGAGIDAVLENDADSRLHLPGGGANAAAFRDGARFQQFNVREIPIAFQLPDWNHWLPRVHPLDSALGSTFLTSEINTAYEQIRKGLRGELGMSRDEYIYAQLRQDLDAWRTTFDLGRSGSPFNTLGPTGGAQWTRAQVKEKYAAAVWGASKQFEIMHEFELEEKGRELYGLQGESRQWFANRHIFNISPHLMGMTDQPFPVVGDGSSPVTSPVSCGYAPLPACGPTTTGALYLANSWYYLQMILNPGARNAVTGGWDTMDWDYTRGLMSALFWHINDPIHGRASQDMRGMILAYKGMEQGDNGYGPDGRGVTTGEAPWWGWDLRDNAAWMANTVVPEAENALSRAVKPTLYQVWLEKSGTFSRAQWQAGLFPRAQVGNLSAPPPTYTIPNWMTPAQDYEDFASLLAYNTRYVRAWLTDAPDAISNGMATLGETIWPNNPWSELRRYALQAPPASLQAVPGVERVALSWATVPGATSYNIKRSESISGPFRVVQLLVQDNHWTERDLNAGQTYHYRVSANIGLSETLDSGSIASAMPLTGLVGYWSFDESSGVSAGDASVSANHGTLLGAARTAGVRGNAVHAGPGAYVAFGRNLRWLSGDFTLTAWVTTTASGGATLNDMPALTGSTGNTTQGPDAQRRLVLGAVDASGRIGVYVGDTAAVVSSEAVNDGRWRHIAVTRQQSTGMVRLYIDGALSASGVLTDTYLWQRAHGLGRPDQPDWQNYWQGGMDEVRLFNQALNATDIGAIYAGVTTEAPALPEIAPAEARYGSAYINSVSVTGNPLPVVSASGLPPGLQFAGGVITGTPQLAGTFTVTLSATNGVGVPAERTMALVVARAPLTVTAVSSARQVGQSNPPLLAAYAGFVNGDTAAVLTGVPVLSTTADGQSAAGVYPIAVSAGTLASPNYVFRFVSGMLTVNDTPQPLTRRTYLALMLR